MSEALFVGTSDAFGAGGRRQSAIVVRGTRGTTLLDCGVTTNTGLSDLGVSRDEIDSIVISHFHGDHFGGIPLFVLAAMYEDRRNRPLTIAGPPGIEQRVRALADAMGHHLNDRGYDFDLAFEEVIPGRPYDLGSATVESFPTHHQIEANPHGYRVDLGDRRLAYSGDTGWFDRLPAEVAGSDLFVCECTLVKAHLDFHLSLEQLAEKSREFDVGRMLLTHLGKDMCEQREECELETADDGVRVGL